MYTCLTDFSRAWQAIAFPPIPDSVFSLSTIRFTILLLLSSPHSFGGFYDECSRRDRP